MKYFVILLLLLSLSPISAAQECISELRTVYSMGLKELNDTKMCLEIPKNPSNTRSINKAILQQRECLEKNKKESFQTVADYSKHIHDHSDVKRLSELEALIDRPQKAVGSNRRGKEFLTSVSDACIKSFKRDLKINIIYEPNIKETRRLFALSTPWAYNDDKSKLPYLLLTDSPSFKSHKTTLLKKRICIPRSPAEHYNIKDIDRSEYRTLLKISAYEKIMGSGTVIERKAALKDLVMELKVNPHFEKLFKCDPSPASNAQCRIHKDTNNLILSPEIKELRNQIYQKIKSDTDIENLAFEKSNDKGIISPKFLFLLQSLKTYAVDLYKRQLVNESASISKRDSEKIFSTLSADDLIAHASSNERLYRHMREVKALVCRNIRNTSNNSPVVVNIIAQKDGGRLKKLLKDNFNTKRINKFHPQSTPTVLISEQGASNTKIEKIKVESLPAAAYERTIGVH